jgi:hypothetical protein
MNSKKAWLPTVLFFIFSNGFLITATKFLNTQGIDKSVVIAGNIILCSATVISILIAIKSLKKSNPSASIRALFGSLLLKFFICLIPLLVYVMIAKKLVNKPALFTCMGLYIVYTVLEVVGLQKLFKQVKNA